MNLTALKKGIRSLIVTTRGLAGPQSATPHPHPRRSLAVALASLLLAAAIGPVAAASLDSEGWTNLVPSPDSRIIYVSDSQGNDSNDGMTPQTPVKTIAKGYSLLRNGFPDWMLLKRGDTFTEQVLHAGWGRSGRSLEEPMVVSSYGDSPKRPMILSPATTAALQAVNGSHNHIALVGLHFEPFNRQPNQKPYGIRWLAGATNFLIEDCYFAGYRDNIMFHSYNGSTLSNVRIRRSVIVDAWSSTTDESSSHSQGIYANNIDGLLIEECVFDHNGWNTSVSGANATFYNHNLYIDRENKNVIVRGNVIARGSATGVQQRPGGLNENNLALRNPTNILFGQFQAKWPAEAVSGTVRNNVVFDSHDIDGSPRGYGIWFQQVKNVEAYGNIVAHQKTGTGNINGIIADYNYHDLTIRDNIVYDWGHEFALRFSGWPGGNVHVKDNRVQQPNSGILVLMFQVSMNPFTFSGNEYFATSSSPFSPGTSFSGWLSASSETGAAWKATTLSNSCSEGSAAAAADIPAYMQCLGYDGSIEAFLDEARKQSRLTWRPEFTAQSVNAAVRGAFGLPANGLN